MFIRIKQTCEVHKTEKHPRQNAEEFIGKFETEDHEDDNLEKDTEEHRDFD